MSNNPSEREKTLEMRIAALEDKLSQSSVTEDEIKAYQKVASLIASRAGASAAGTPAAQTTSPCVASNLSPIYNCILSCYIYPHVLPRPTILDCIQAEASGAASGTSGAQFGSLGKQQQGS
jgi:hypothetical protein